MSENSSQKASSPGRGVTVESFKPSRSKYFSLYKLFQNTGKEKTSQLTLQCEQTLETKAKQRNGNKNNRNIPIVPVVIDVNHIINLQIKC